jgi:hypothetical protein
MVEEDSAESDGAVGEGCVGIRQRRQSRCERGERAIGKEQREREREREKERVLRRATDNEKSDKGVEVEEAAEQNRKK